MRFPLDEKILIMPGGDAAGHLARGEGIANDYRASTGTPVHMPWDGLIQLWFGGSGDTGGYWIAFKDKSGNSIQLAHLSQRLKHPGEFVKEGEVIALTGNTGTHTTGPHLHFQIIKPNGSRIDPALYDWGQEEAVTLEQELHIKWDGAYEMGLNREPENAQVVDARVGKVVALINAGKPKWEAQRQVWDEEFVRTPEFRDKNQGILG